jgi:cellulose biosynthesis protein BcsQ
MGEIITFYSYKGGTGRSMALANVAHILAWRVAPPKKVLMIDWDLEAPGLHKYFFDELKVNFSAATIRGYPTTLNEAPGLIDFLHEVAVFYQTKYPSDQLGVMHAETDKAESAFRAALSSHPLAEYVLKVDSPDNVSSRADRPPGLFLLKAGNQKASKYVEQIRAFDWQKFYDQYGSFFTHFRELLASEYDHVLIDSRTGLTDIGDICTRVMPEKLVAVFVPNRQNLDGLIEMVRGAAEYRKSSRDPRPLVAFPLASRIDGNASRLRSIWWRGGTLDGQKMVGYEERFEELFRSIYAPDKCDLGLFFDSTQVPHDSDYAYGERVAAREGSFDKLSIGGATDSLTQYIVKNCAPWENPGAEPRESSAATDFPSAGTMFSPLLGRFTGPAIIAVLGALIAFAGPVLEELYFRDGSEGSKEISIGSVTATASASNIAGFGVGTATISLVLERSSSTGQIVLFKIDRGTITPKALLVETDIPDAATAKLRSEGFGPEKLLITTSSGLAIKEGPTEQQSTGPPRGESRTLRINYRWPIALTAAAIGGALLGFALQLRHTIESGFGLPSVAGFVVLIGGSFAISAVALNFYLAFADALLQPELRYNGFIIAAIAASGPITFEAFAASAIRSIFGARAKEPGM